MGRSAELVAANTSAYGGFDLPTALRRIAALGYKKVEIAAMYGLVEHIAQEELNQKKATEVRRIMEQYGLESTAFSAHLFLNRPDAVDLFIPRMEFAKAIGASIINTKAGALSALDQFLRNMEILIRQAEKIGLKIGLETHGDIVNHGPAAVEAVRRFQSDYVILNYDFGNVLINSRGQVDPAADFALIMDRVGHLHLKDAVLRDDHWEWTAIGQGTIDYPRIFTGLQQQARVLPLTVDLPLSLVLDRQAQAGKAKEPMGLDEIDRIMLASLHFVRQY